MTYHNTMLWCHCRVMWCYSMALWYHVALLWQSIVTCVDTIGHYNSEIGHGGSPCKLYSSVDRETNHKREEGSTVQYSLCTHFGSYLESDSKQFTFYTFKHSATFGKGFFMTIITIKLRVWLNHKNSFEKHLSFAKYLWPLPQEWILFNEKQCSGWAGLRWNLIPQNGRRLPGYQVAYIPSLLDGKQVSTPLPLKRKVCIFNSSGFSIAVYKHGELVSFYKGTVKQ